MPLSNLSLFVSIFLFSLTLPLFRDMTNKEVPNILLINISFVRESVLIPEQLNIYIFRAVLLISNCGDC